MATGALILPGPAKTEAEALLSIEQACARAAAYARPVRLTETVPLHRAKGRILAEDLAAVRPCPPFAQSAMDGYALPGPCPAGTRFEVAGRIAAGHSGHALQAEAAMRIFTGAPIPPSAATVVMQEHVERDGSAIILKRDVGSGDNIRHEGEDVAPGQVLMRAGQQVDARHVAIVAAQGVASLRVRALVRVAIASTGDEVRSAGEGPATGACIYDSNRPMLLAAAAGSSVDVIDAGCLPDDPESLAAALSRLATEVDLIVTTGGVSVGEEDHSAAALSMAGGTGEQLKIAMKPGKPAVVGRIGCALYLGLPGNPMSALVSWSLLGRAVLARLQAGRFERPRGLPVRLGTPLMRKPGRTEFVPVRLAWGATEPELQVLPSNSGRLRPLVDADGLAEIPAEMASAAPGTLLRFHAFAEMLA